jgi:hypothetical protein
MKIDLVQAFKSLDMKKPRITKGLNWQGFEVVKIEKLNNDYQIHLQGGDDGDYQEVKSWETIKRFNNLEIKKYLEILDTVSDDSNYSQLTFSILSEIQLRYKELSNFYYDGLKTSFLTDTDKSLETS